jgi:flagellar hook-associated protein 3 FlgL
MPIGRINSTIIANNTIRSLRSQLQNLGRTQEQISTGQKINRPSDDPVGMSRVTNVNNTLRFDERFISNISQGQSELKALDDLIQQGHGIATRALELTVQAGNITMNAQNRAVIATEVDQLISQLTQVGNTNFAGRYILSGFETDGLAFTRTGDNITYNGSPVTDFQRTISVSENDTVPVNVHGESLFGSVTVAAGPPPSVSGGSGLFRTLVSLKLDLEANNVTGIQSRLDQLHTHLQTINLVQGDAAGNLGRLDDVMERIEAKKDYLTEEYAKLTTIDLAEVITRLRQQEQTYEASLMATGKITTMSLMDFMR